MNSIINNLKREFIKSTILNKLIYINIIIFIFFSFLEVLSFMFQFNISPIMENLYLPANKETLIKQPWTFITYMFLHTEFLHLMFNMIWLYFGGKLFLQYLNKKQLINIYLLGGVFGGTLFIVSYNYVPALTIYTQNAKALGSSAAVLAIIVAIATHVPNHIIRLPLIGNILLKYIAIFMVTIDILSIPKGNSGGHIAHIGGAIFGYIYINQLKKEKKYKTKFNKLIKKIFNNFKLKPKLRKVYKRAKSDFEFNTEKANNQKEIDNILEKISKSGYESLSSKEKSTLFNASKK